MGLKMHVICSICLASGVRKKAVALILQVSNFQRGTHSSSFCAFGKIEDFPESTASFLNVES
jgi:hypothetical protein